MPPKGLHQAPINFCMGGWAHLKYQLAHKCMGFIRKNLSSSNHLVKCGLQSPPCFSVVTKACPSVCYSQVNKSPRDVHQIAAVVCLLDLSAAASALWKKQPVGKLEWAPSPVSHIPLPFSSQFSFLSFFLFRTLSHLPLIVSTASLGACLPLPPFLLLPLGFFTHMAF